MFSAEDELAIGFWGGIPGVIENYQQVDHHACLEGCCGACLKPKSVHTGRLAGGGEPASCGGASWNAGVPVLGLRSLGSNNQKQPIVV
jgi:hypothetical protein